MSYYVAQGMDEDAYRDADIALRKQELLIREKEAKNSFWTNLATVASVMIPIVTFLGLQSRTR